MMGPKGRTRRRKNQLSCIICGTLFDEDELYTIKLKEYKGLVGVKWFGEHEYRSVYNTITFWVCQVCWDYVGDILECAYETKKEIRIQSVRGRITAIYYPSVLFTPEGLEKAKEKIIWWNTDTSSYPEAYDDGENYVCPVCGFKHPRYIRVSSHILEKHKPEKPKLENIIQEKLKYISFENVRDVILKLADDADIGYTIYKDTPREFGIDFGGDNSVYIEKMPDNTIYAEAVCECYDPEDAYILQSDERKVHIHDDTYHVHVYTLPQVIRVVKYIIKEGY